MTLTLQEISDICPDWEKFCELSGFSYYALNEGGGDTQVYLTTDQAHHLGIVKKEAWNLKPFEEVYPDKTKH